MPHEGLTGEGMTSTQTRDEIQSQGQMSPQFPEARKYDLAMHSAGLCVLPVVGMVRSPASATEADSQMLGEPAGDQRITERASTSNALDVYIGPTGLRLFGKSTRPDVAGEWTPT
jgi:hypothetical protein